MTFADSLGHANYIIDRLRTERPKSIAVEYSPGMFTVHTVWLPIGVWVSSKMGRGEFGRLFESDDTDPGRYVLKRK